MTNNAIIKIYIFLFILIFWLVLALYVELAIAQEDENEKFANAGLISISNKYNLSEKTNTIIFRIKNNTTRTIKQIYGWIYIHKQNPEDKGNSFTLANNPHRGGNIIKGQPHSPGTISEWSFPLLNRHSKESQQMKYSLRVHPRSIFFSRLEEKVNNENIE